jgi:hypothetical protein
MAYPGQDPLCCPPKRASISGFGATVGKTHFAPARPVAPTEYTTLERVQAKAGLSQSANPDDYKYSQGSWVTGTQSQYGLPQQSQLVDTPTQKLGLSQTDWMLIGAGTVVIAAGIYFIARKS